MDSDLARTAVGSAAPRSGRRGVRPGFLLILLLLAGGAVAAWYVTMHRANRMAAPATLSEPAVPVVVQQAAKRDFPINLTGIGTVTGFNTVLVRARVDGRIDSIGFAEGQDVQQGDVLARLDPRSFEAVLRQLEANLKKDQANLAN